jgi:organic hydroperoxide reductase OsmC/OhrA
MTKQVLYTGKTHTTGGREGAARSNDGRLDIQLSSPGSSGQGTNPDSGYFLAARLNVSLPGVDQATARAVVDGAHEACPYSKLSRGNIDVEINLVAEA